MVVLELLRPAALEPSYESKPEPGDSILEREIIGWSAILDSMIDSGRLAAMPPGSWPVVRRGTV